jgi:nucleotide-binding universal stress UspA family protein
MQNIFVPLTGCENDTRALEAAYFIASRSGDHIYALHVRPDPMQIVTRAAVQQFGSEMGNVELIHLLQKAGEARSAAAAATFDQFLKRHFAPGVARSARTGTNASMEDIEGDPIADTASRARYYDLVVLARAREGDDFTTDAIANILVGCGRPVLLVPDKAIHDIGAAIAIAWKETPEAARAVTAAMPLFKDAKKVWVLGAAETKADSERNARSAELLAGQLRRHGIAAEARSVPVDPRGSAEALLQAAHDAKTDLLVMGAYGHSRVRELVFGGFTRRVLKACDLPVLMLH